MSEKPEMPENQPESELDAVPKSIDDSTTQESSELERISETAIDESPVSEIIAPDPIATANDETIDPNNSDVSPKKEGDTIVIQRATLNYAVVAVVFFVVGLVVGSVSFGSNVNEEAIENAVQNVLVDAGLIQAPADMDLLVDDDPYLGPEDAPIVIVEFSAYACPYCGRHFNETLEPLLETYGEHIRYVYRDFPTINPDISFPAALAANCAFEQDMFWEYHESLFVNQTTLTQTGQAYMTQLASDLGLDMEQFNECFTQQTYLDEVNNDFNTGVAYGVSGTPAFYINGQAHSGARPYQYFENIIRRELDEAGIDY